MSLLIGILGISEDSEPIKFIILCDNVLWNLILKDLLAPRKVKGSHIIDDFEIGNNFHYRKYPVWTYNNSHLKKDLLYC